MIDISSIQNKLSAPKDNTNQYGGFKYRTAEGILAVVKPLLAEQNMVLTLSDEVKSLGEYLYIESTARLVSGEKMIECKAIAGIELGKKGNMDMSQKFGSASSYARKYALCGMFCIDDSSIDPDTRQITTTHSIDHTDKKENGKPSTMDKKMDKVKSMVKEKVSTTTPATDVINKGAKKGQLWSAQSAEYLKEVQAHPDCPPGTFIRVQLELDSRKKD
mgnify:CR=1 FL=1|jgi:hypothetical protein|tara:strand:- start:2575 stop:3228 length:654 start_codon:yes stop_codon:yes gene_type:complete